MQLSDCPPLIILAPSLMRLAFSDASLLAVGDAFGCVTVWQLSPALAHAHEEDRACMQRIAQAGAEDE